MKSNEEDFDWEREDKNKFISSQEFVSDFKWDSNCKKTFFIESGKLLYKELVVSRGGEDCGCCCCCCDGSGNSDEDGEENDGNVGFVVVVVDDWLKLNGDADCCCCCCVLLLNPPNEKLGWVVDGRVPNIVDPVFDCDVDEPNNLGGGEINVIQNIYYSIINKEINK